jgi:hypothetical protein
MRIDLSIESKLYPGYPHLSFTGSPAHICVFDRACQIKPSIRVEDFAADGGAYRFVEKAAVK